MVKIACSTICYQDRIGLQRAIESCYEHIDKFIVVDGRYPRYGLSTDPLYSTDGTEEYCKSLDKVDYYKLSAEQPVKRTFSFARTKEHDCEFLIVMDADDYIHHATNWEQFYTFLDTFNFDYWHDKPYAISNPKPIMVTTTTTPMPNQIYNVEFIMDPTRKQWIGRLFYKPYELTYINHWQVTREIEGKQRRTIHYPKPSTRLPAFPVPGLVMSSDDMTRPKDRLMIDVEYQWSLFLEEGVITKEEFEDSRRKKEFAEAIISEYIVWEKYYKAKGLKTYEENREKD